MREVTQIFLSRAELVPAGETTEEHRRLQQEEAETVELDKTSLAAGGGGLFRGRFRYFAPAPRRTMPVIRDIQDGVDRCPQCTWELEDGECGSCGYTVFADFRDDTGSLSDSVSSSLSEIYAQQELEDRQFLERQGLSGLEDGGSEFDYFSDTDVSFADHINRPYGGIDIEELASMGRIAARGRNRRRVLTETDLDRSSADDEDAGSLDGFVVNDGEDLPNSPGGQTSIPDDWSPARGSSPRIRSSHIGSPSTHYDTEEITGIEEDSGTTRSDYEDFPNDIAVDQNSLGNGQIRGTRLGRIQRRAGQRRARVRPMSENSGLNDSDQVPAFAVRGSTQDESEDGSDPTPVVRSRRRARFQRLSSSSGSDSGRSGMPTFRGPSLSRRNQQHNNNSTLARGFSPLHPNPGSHQRGSGSSNGTSRGVPIEIESDSDSPVPPRRSRARRTANPDLSDEDQVSTAGDAYGWTQSPQSSSGTATVGRQSPAHNTAMTPVLHQPGPTSNSISPILIGSSPTRTEDLLQTSGLNTRRNEISRSPLVLQNGTRYVRVAPRASTDRDIAHPPRQSPRSRQRTHRITSRSPRHPSTNPSGSMLSPGSSNPVSRQQPTNEALSGSEQRRQRAASNEAVRKAARKAEKKRLKRERRQREQNQAATANVAGEAFGRRW